MSAIGKYALLLLLIGNLASQYVPFNPIAGIIFYGTLVLGAMYCIYNCKGLFIKDNIKAASFIFVFVAMYLLYQFTFGLFYIEKISLMYLAAKITVLLIIFWGITLHYEFYYRKIIPYLSITIAILIVYGLFFHNYIIHGRFTLGFGNPNSTSAIAAIGFAAFLLIKMPSKYISIAGVIICLFGVLAGGSRASIMVCMIALFFKYRFSVKTVVLIIGCLLVALYIIPMTGYKVIGLDRIMDVFANGNFVGSRQDVRRATMMMINEHPVIGWGLRTGIQGEAAKLTTMGAHNGYLDTIKAIGYPYAAILFGACIYIFYRMRLLFKEKSPYVKFHLFVIISVLLAAMYESYIIGVNQIITNLLFVSVAVLEYRCYYNIQDEDTEEH